MSRDNWLGWEDFLPQLSILRRDRVSQGKEKLCRDIEILCCDRLDQGRDNFGRDKGFLGHDRACHDRKLCRTQQGWVCKGWRVRQCAVLCRDKGGHARATRQAGMAID